MGTALPVIVGFGGYNAAGRSSGHQAFKRTVLESISAEQQQQTIVGIACLMGCVKWDGENYISADAQKLNAAQVDQQFRQQVLDGTLIRKIERFDPAFVPGHKTVSFEDTAEGPMTFTMQKRDLPTLLEDNWHVEDLEDGRVKVTCDDLTHYLVQSHYELSAKAAGQLPTGFNPGDHYNSRFHPRGLQLALAGVSDALYSTGIPLDKLLNVVSPDQIGTYASSVIGQLDQDGFAGLLQARLRGGRTTAKQLPLGLNTMPADFINAYVLGSIGHTEAITGACATFLYVLQAAVRDITSGVRRIAVVGNAEAAVTPEVMEGFINMSALGNDDNLCKLDGSDTPDYRRASRPFGYNCGFSIAESTQYLILMDDALAIELGADIHGAVPAVYINADGVKKSISAPGAGNYVSFAKAVATAMQVAGEESVRKHSFVHAHGSSTPANRITESELIDRVAASFEIFDWPVTAAKAFVGHSLSAASGDQLMSALGTFKYDIIPGIKTIDAVAPDVYQDHLHFPLQDLDVSENRMEVAFVNSKGFGGNNATAVILSPGKVEQMLDKRYGSSVANYRLRREAIRAVAAEYQQRADCAQLDVIYRFGEQMIDEGAISIDRQGVSVPGYAQKIAFTERNPWSDMA